MLNETSVDLKRASPAYLQWQESQSCFRNVQKLSSIVSASSLAWRNSSSFSHSPSVHTWLKLSPLLSSWNSSSSFFSMLQEKNILKKASDLGIGGIYFTGTLENSSSLQGGVPEFSDGENACSFDFSSLSGSDYEYAALLKAAVDFQLPLGAQLIPSALYAGPDFALALRNVRFYPGLFAMMEIPKRYWKVLPNQGMKEFAILSQEALDTLSHSFVLPTELFADSFSLSGWAVTSEIRGVDGVNRRWAYRWHNRPEFPVLHWDDPSGAARQLINANLILQVGLRHNLMIGWRPWAMAGLDVINHVTKKKEAQFEPALSAIHDIAGNAHRYGAFLYIEDTVSPEHIPLIQNAGADLVQDSFLSSAILLSVLQKSAIPIYDALSKLKKLSIDERRLLHNTEAVILSTLLSLPQEWQKRFCSKEIVLINAPTAALLSFSGTTPSASIVSHSEKISKVHLLQLACHAFLPGAFMISPSDLLGVIPAEQEQGYFPTVVSFDGSTVNKRGLASGLSLYHGLLQDNFHNELKKILSIRNNLHISEGTVEKLFDTKGELLAFTLSLPENRQLIFIANFSDKNRSAFSYPSLKQYLYGLNDSKADAILSHTFSPWEWKFFLLEKQ